MGMVPPILAFFVGRGGTFWTLETAGPRTLPPGQGMAFASEFSVGIGAKRALLYRKVNKPRLGVELGARSGCLGGARGTGPLDPQKRDLLSIVGEGFTHTISSGSKEN